MPAEMGVHGLEQQADLSEDLSEEATPAANRAASGREARHNEPKAEPADTEIIGRLDVRAVYAEYLNINGNKPNAEQWWPFTPSAAMIGTRARQSIVTTGRYKDHGGDGESLSLWDFVAKHDNRFSDSAQYATISRKR